MTFSWTINLDATKCLFDKIWLNLNSNWKQLIIPLPIPALLYSDKNLKRIRKRINIDLKLLVHWLHANKIGLNVDKTEAILFRSAKKKVDYDLKLKLNGKKFQLVSPVRYLGIVLDENLSWTHHKNSLAGKLRKSNGALSKLRHYIPRATIVSIYFSLFHSHLSYSIQVWGKNISENCRIIKL